MNSWKIKNLYLRSLVKKLPRKENLNPINPRYKYLCKYYAIDSEGVQQQVCLQFLSKCLHVSKSKLKRITEFVQTNPIGVESRGKCAKKKYAEIDVKFLRSFIETFPTYESHYKSSKSNSSKKYLSPFLNIRRMYKEYCLKNISPKKAIN